MRQMLLKGIVLVAALAAFLVVGAGQALASHVNCGDTITQDTTLDSDLLNCPGDGVVIGADGITLDLAGHAITGAGEGATGVNDLAGHDSVVVEGGGVRGFQTGIYLKDADGSRVSRMALGQDGTSVQLDNSDAGVIERSTFSGPIPSAGVAVRDGSTDNTIEANSFSGTGNGILLLGSAIPREVRGTQIERNDLVGNGVGVLALTGSVGTVIADNRVSDSSNFAILAAGDTTLLDRNTLSANHLGIFISGPNTRASRNRVSRSATDGIGVSSSTTTFGTVLDRNVTNGNGDDGIDVDYFRTTIERNTANDNGDLGIEAVAGVTDGGGNKARGNGNPAQCTNVQCK
jgi:hypothetical protein